MNKHTMGSKAAFEEATFKDRGFELEQGISNRVVEIRCIVRDVNRTEFLEVMKGYFSPLVPSSSKEKLDEIKRLVVELKKAKNMSDLWPLKVKEIDLAQINLLNYLENF